MLKRTPIIPRLVAVLAFLPILLYPAEARLMKNPDIGFGKIVFTLEDDLWLVSDKGGVASRVTSHPGLETFAKFSPDGKKIAFTAEYDGNRDVYVMPVEGGSPLRLTFHPKSDEVVEWLPGGKAVLFRSERMKLRNAFMVPDEGGPSVPYPFDRVRFASFSPDGRFAALNRNDSDRMNWNGYKGGDQQDIWLADLSRGSFSKLTDYLGYDNHPMWLGNTLFFASDRQDGRMNLYALDLEDKTVRRKTFFKEWDVQSPSMGQDKIVFVSEGSLWVYDIPRGAAERIQVDVASDRWLTRKSYVDPSESIQNIGLSHDGKTSWVQARGDIYRITGRDAANLTQSYSNETSPAPSPDGKWIAFYSDLSGEIALYIASPDRRSRWINLTGDLKTTPYYPVWSPDSKKIVFGDKDYRLCWVDTAEKKVHEIDRSLYQRDNEIVWEVADYDWSPDSKWVAYTKCEPNMNNTVYLYGLDERKSLRLTDDRYDNTSPAFDRNGKWLYFLSLRRIEPLLDPYMDNHINDRMSCVLAFQLQAGQEPPFLRKSDLDEAESGPTKAPGLSIDTAGIGRRIFSVPLPAGTFASLRGGSNGFFYLSKEQVGFPDWNAFMHPKRTSDFSLHKYNTHTRRDTEIINGIGSYSVSGDGSRAAYLSGAFSGVIEPIGEAVKGDGTLDWHGLRQEVDFTREFSVILTDVWRQIRDFFYDPGMHGKDWTAVRKKFEALVPFVSSRSDLNDVIGDMIGELGVSHEYILDEGDLSRKPEDVKVGVGLLGADMEPDMKTGTWRFKHILKGAGWNPLLENPLEAPNVLVREGECLLSIDGEAVSAAKDVYEYLADKAGKTVSLTVNTKSDTAGARTIQIETLRDESALRHFEWTEANYQKVNVLSHGRVGYMHLSDMEETGLREFEKAFRAERFREGLIIDVRGNGGGFVSWFLLDKLERKRVFFTKTRDFMPMSYPHGAHPGPTVFVCNEKTSSDGEVFIEHVKALGLGPVVGTATWGGLVGFNNIIPTLDEGVVSQSNVGFYSPKSGWLVENKGATPDVVVENLPGDVLAGRDPQLEKAVVRCLGLLDKADVRIPDAPAFPKK